MKRKIIVLTVTVAAIAALLPLALRKAKRGI